MFEILFEFILPNGYVNIDIQLKMWSIFQSMLIISLIMYCTIIVMNPIEKKHKLKQRVGCILVVTIMSLPIYNPHQGWGYHGHFKWESPYHLH